MQPTQVTDRHLMLLYRLTQDLNATLAPEAVLERAMEDVIAITRAERGFVLLNEDAWQGGSVQMAARGVDAEILEKQEFSTSRSILRQVLESGEPVISSDAGQDARYRDHESVILQGLRSILCVPVKTTSRVLGAIYVDNRIQRGVFSQVDLKLLSIVAASAATALENARLLRETESRLKTLNLLHHISQQITSSLDLEQVLYTTTLAVKELLGGSTASILTVDGDALTFQVATGESSTHIKPFRVPLGQGIAGWVVEHKQPVMVDDVQNDPRFFGTLDKKTGFVTQNLIAAPLVVNDQAIGVIEVFNKSGGFTLADQELLATFASSAAFAIENARLYQVAVEKGRLERELQVARQVQVSLLPQEMPGLPGWDLAATWLPAREVAGDYYDFIPLHSVSGTFPLHSVSGTFPLETPPNQAQKFGLVIADVADKGTPAALFMVNTRAALRASMFEADSPMHGLTHVNQLVCGDAHDGMFVTLFYAQINSLDGVVTYVNAGHNPPLLARGGGGELELLTRTGMALGVDPSALFAQRAVTLEAGDCVLLYTDGVPDALNEAGQEFGDARLRELVSANREKSAAGLVKVIETALKTHIGETAPFDDITLMALKRL